MKTRAFVVMGFGVAAIALGCTAGPDKDGPLGSTQSALSAPVTLIGPGPVIADDWGTDYQQIVVDRAHSQTLAAGTYVAENFSYQFNLPNYGAPRGSITPLLLTYDGGSYTPVAIGAPVTYTAPTAFISTSFGGSGTFTLAANTTIYAGLYWNDPTGSTPGTDRMPLGFTDTTGSSFILYSSPTGAGGANPPVVGTPISGFGGSASVTLQRAYNFDIGVSSSPPLNEGEIEICHQPPGDPSNFQTITVGEAALRAHLAHGDHTGSCTTASWSTAEGSCSVTLANGAPVYIWSLGTLLGTYQNLPNALIGTTGSCLVNGGDVTLTLTQASTCYLLRGDNWQPVPTDGWTLAYSIQEAPPYAGTSYWLSTDYTYNTTVGAQIFTKTLAAGTYTFDAASAYYACSPN